LYYLVKEAPGSKEFTMNRLLLQNYISEYERMFDDINKDELYKWRAVKQFQDYWNVDADDFLAMLSSSLSKTGNLMNAGNYWPKRVIIKLAEQEPQLVRKMFIDLFDEDVDLLQRINLFQKEVNKLTAYLFPDKKSYQDIRAVLVYLNLKYPETYFFYKYEMFKTFCEKLEYDFAPKRGEISNVIQFLELCEIVRAEIRSNKDLLTRHNNRIGNSEYFDAESNILTQDFIYATTVYLDVSGEPEPVVKPRLTLIQIPFELADKTYQFKGTYVDYAAKQKRNKIIGNRGEEFVLQYEKDHCPPKYANNIVHSSKIEGDGLGYDILSFDSNGSEKYIEVKTTSSGLNRSFFITGAELERSKKEGENYYLYRLYHFNEKNMTADFIILRGDLSRYCTNPVEFEVVMNSYNIS
jgi:hypothetical protein